MVFNDQSLVWQVLGVRDHLTRIVDDLVFQRLQPPQIYRQKLFTIEVFLVFKTRLRRRIGCLPAFNNGLER